VVIPDGSVEITIERPLPDRTNDWEGYAVLSAVVAPDGESTIEVHAPFMARHWAALHEAIEATGAEVQWRESGRGFTVDDRWTAIPS
jgi:hypothetical protein